MSAWFFFVVSPVRLLQGYKTDSGRAAAACALTGRRGINCRLGWAAAMIALLFISSAADALFRHPGKRLSVGAPLFDACKMIESVSVGEQCGSH